MINLLFYFLYVHYLVTKPLYLKITIPYPHHFLLNLPNSLFLLLILIFKKFLLNIKNYYIAIKESWVKYFFNVTQLSFIFFKLYFKLVIFYLILFYLLSLIKLWIFRWNFGAITLTVIKSFTIWLICTSQVALNNL